MYILIYNYEIRKVTLILPEASLTGNTYTKRSTFVRKQLIKRQIETNLKTFFNLFSPFDIRNEQIHNQTKLTLKLNNDCQGIIKNS